MYEDYASVTYKNLAELNLMVLGGNAWVNLRQTAYLTPGGFFKNVVMITSYITLQ